MERAGGGWLRRERGMRSGAFRRMCRSPLPGRQRRPSAHLAPNNAPAPGAAFLRAASARLLAKLRLVELCAVDREPRLIVGARRGSGSNGVTLKASANESESPCKRTPCRKRRAVCCRVEQRTRGLGHPTFPALPERSPRQPALERLGALRAPGVRSEPAVRGLSPRVTCSSNQTVADSGGLLARTGKSRSNEQSGACELRIGGLSRSSATLAAGWPTRRPLAGRVCFPADAPRSLHWSRTCPQGGPCRENLPRDQPAGKYTEALLPPVQTISPPSWLHVIV